MKKQLAIKLLGQRVAASLPLFTLLLLLPLPLHASQTTERAAAKPRTQKGKSARAKSKPVDELARLREEYIKAINEYQALLKKQLPGRERDVERAQDQLTKMNQLFAEGLISKQELETSERALSEAKNKVSEISQEVANADSRIADTLLAIVIVVGSAVHAILIEGTMETVSKAALCALVLAAAIKVIADLRVWRKRATSRGESVARQ